MTNLMDRRAAFGAIAGLSALAAGIAPTAASPVDVDAGLLDLLERWRAAHSRKDEAYDRFVEAECEVDKITVPPAMIVTNDDRQFFGYSAKEIGRPIQGNVVEFLQMAIAVSMRFNYAKEPFLLRMVDRANEVTAAYHSHWEAVEAARQRIGFGRIASESDAADEEEAALRRQVAAARPKSLNGLLAKLTAIGEVLGRDDLERETVFDEGDIPDLEQLATTVLRDGLNLVRPS